MFTSIEKLRASHAMQDRVSSVERWLKRQNPNYLNAEKFPIFVIGNSNAVADVDWVISVNSTHIGWPEMHKAVLAEFGHKTIIEHNEYVEQLFNKSTKANALAELNQKYVNAYSKAGVAIPNYFGGLQPVGAAAQAIAPAPAATETPQVVQEEVKAATPVAAPAPVAPAVNAKAEAEAKLKLRGIVHTAIGQVMSEKLKTFEDAVRWSQSPTGSRTFSAYAEANGADAREAREDLKAFAQAATFPLSQAA